MASQAPRSYGPEVENLLLDHLNLSINFCKVVFVSGVSISVLATFVEPLFCVGPGDFAAGAALVQHACTKELEKAGARATTTSPLAHLAMEADEKNEGGAVITLQIWPKGEKYNLGRVDFHGRWINWSKDSILT